LVLAGLVIAGCAGGSVASGAPPTSAPTTIAPTFGPLPSGEPGQMPPMRDPIDVTGVVEAGVESGCVILRTEEQVYQLSGSDPLIQPGARLTVRGWLRPDVMTTCQQGPVLDVLEVRAAE
jgi:hypothetical protein